MVIFIIRNTVRSALRALMPTVLAVCYGDDRFLIEKWEQVVLNKRKMVTNFYDFLLCF